jgi:iron complex outermembrane recepter protein
MRLRQTLTVGMFLTSPFAIAAEAIDTLFGDNEVVISPTRLKQPISDVPAAVTVITSSTIDELGIRSITDALRLVPGMSITQPTGNDFRVNYHGTNIQIPRRMTVLIDGVSMYRPGLGRIDWKELPVAIDDVDRIEVTRGSNSAAYGPNSMLASINIITKRPSETARLSARTTLGSNSESYAHLGLAGTVGETAYRFSVGYSSDQGYDSLPRGGDHDDTRLLRASFRSISQLTRSSTIDFSTGVSHGTKEIPFVDVYQKTFGDQKTTDFFLNVLGKVTVNPANELSIRASHAQNSVRQTWVTCIPNALLLPELYDLWAANRAYAQAVVAGRVPTGASASDNALAARAVAAVAGLGANATRRNCASPNQDLDQSRTELDIHDSFSYGSWLRGIIGVGARHDIGESATFLRQRITYDSLRAYTHIEYRLTPNLVSNLGAYAEKIEGLATSLQPRVSLNYSYDSNHSVRAILSQASRSPDMLEREGIFSYTAIDAEFPINGSRTVRFYQSGRSKQPLTPERIFNREIGYAYKSRTSGIDFDVKVFSDQLSNLISEKLQVSNFDPTNKGRVDLRGVEVQGSINAAPRFRVFGHYAYLDNRDSNNVNERTQWSRHSGAFGAVVLLPYGLTTSAVAYLSTANGLGQSPYRRLDVSLAKPFVFAGSKANVAINVSYLDTPQSTYYQDAGSILKSSYKEKLTGFLTLRVAY